MTRAEPVTFLDGRVQLWLGDCRDVLPRLPDESVDMIWTDPPYGHSNHDGDWNSRLNAHRGVKDKPIANDDAVAMREVVDAALAYAARLLIAAAAAAAAAAARAPRSLGLPSVWTGVAFLSSIP